MSDYSWFKALEPKIKFKNAEDLRKQIIKEEKRCKRKPDSIKLIRLKEQLSELEKMSLKKFLG